MRHLFVTTMMFVMIATVLPAARKPSPNPDPKISAADKLRALFEEDWENDLREFPTQATYVGDPRYNDRWPDMSEQAIERRRGQAREVLRRIKAIDRTKLSETDKLNYDLFRRNAEQSVEGQRFPSELTPINQMGGVHQNVADIAQLSPRSTVKDYENLIKRLQGVPSVVDQNIALMRRGLAAGVTPPRITLREVGRLIGNQLVEDPASSPIYQVAFTEIPDSIPAAEQTRLRSEATRAIAEGVVPAYRKLQRFFIDEYEPKTRESIGLSAVPNGKEWYAFQVRTMTTTNLSPDAIHEIGLSEVKRIRGEMELGMRKAGFKGTLAEFFKFLRTDPQFFYTDKDALLTAYRDIAKKIDPELPKVFGTLPRLPYGVIPVPPYSEKTQTTAYYNPGSLQAGRSGYFYANTYDLASRPKWEMEALTAHEAVPGHHLQIALAQELGEVPKFRRFGGYTAFVEGWGLYSESLGGELGLYKDPYSKFGQLTYEMWRAIRLVVDTGMHAKGWTRQAAIDFFKENAGKSEHDITVEVDRYIVWPGQALAYKLGELKIKELRAYASKELGEKFDIRRFHDMVLGSGALPLEILDSRTREWVAKEKRKS